MARLSLNATFYWKLFVCGLCELKYGITRDHPITEIPKCPSCDAVTTGTHEVKIIDMLLEE